MTEKATFGGGCFWCTEAIFKELNGVISVENGYAGGSMENPLYADVSKGTTGHVEVVRISFDPEKISYEELLDVFWNMHDPTTLNRQGVDVGTQYRSVIFYHDEEQKRLAEESKRKLEGAGTYKNPIVTEIVPFKNFFKAEEYHQNYYERNREAPYCQIVIDPKLEKLRKQFKSSLKE